MKQGSCLKILPAITAVLLLMGYIEVNAACSHYTPLECTPEQRRAMQANKFYQRQGESPAEISQRQQAQIRADREAQLARQEREEARRLEAYVRIEEAKRYSRQRGNVIITPYPYVYMQNGVYTNAFRPRPSHPARPVLKGHVYSLPSKSKRVSSAN